MNQRDKTTKQARLVASSGVRETFIAKLSCTIESGGIPRMIAVAAARLGASASLAESTSGDSLGVSYSYSCQEPVWHVMLQWHMAMISLGLWHSIVTFACLVSPLHQQQVKQSMQVRRDVGTRCSFMIVQAEVSSWLWFQ